MRKVQWWPWLFLGQGFRWSSRPFGRQTIQRGDELSRQTHSLRLYLTLPFHGKRGVPLPLSFPRSVPSRRLLRGGADGDRGRVLFGPARVRLVSERVRLVSERVRLVSERVRLVSERVRLVSERVRLVSE